MFTRGLAQKLHGDVAMAVQTFTEAAAEGKRVNNLHIEFLSLGHLGDALVLQGRLRAAQKTFQETLTAPQEILQRTPFIGISRAGLGNLAYERNELETAEEHFRAAIEYGLLWRNWETLLPGYAGIAHIRASEGNWQAAFAAVDELLENIQEKVGLVQTSVGALRALLNFRKGDVDLAERWAEDYEPERSCDYIVEWEGDALVGCRVWIADNQVERASKLLERIASEASSAGRNARWLEATCLQAILFAKMRRDPDALASLSKTLEMGSREDYIRMFVDEGKPMAELLSEAVSRRNLSCICPPAVEGLSRSTTRQFAGQRAC